MSFSTFALVAAALAAAGAASAQPIRVLTPPGPLRAPPQASECVAAAPGSEVADVECVLRLTPPRRGAQAAPSRILIRTQWAPQRSPRGEAQIVHLAGKPARATALPIVE
ncbi:MAG: hypothetical protein EPO51_03865 [Phenylobacterium sp.]|uniref:hypothetical protein n=1 Tax=Phenylobacterium sp. TaxID=1871053 RepID=UPI001227BB4A|nr:hypothetical protein [Phenylobacterium sp.]TAJ73977.1 MAG: hypothetical protein EPO51_03865 [Phenylobacterium sp.]